MVGLNQPVQAAAGINKQLNFQGRLLTATGAVVPDGNYNIRFKLYQDGPGNVAGDTGGTLKWTELWQNSVATGSSSGVVVKNGYFSVALGTYCAFAGGSCQGNTNTAVDFNQDTLWLSMDVGGTAVSNTPTYDGEMLPMKRLSSAVYAMQADNAGKLGGLTSGQYVQLAQGVQTDSSTSNPSIVVNKTGGTADIIDLQRGGASVLKVNNAGQATFRPSTDSASALVVQKAGTTTNILTVDTSNSRVGVNMGASNPQATFEVSGGALLSGAGSNLTSYTAVTGGIPSTLAVQKYAVAAGAASIAAGLTSGAADHATGLSVFDARSNTNLWPAIALWSQSENRLAGFSWEGGSSTAYVKSTGGDLGLKVDTTTLLTASSSDLSVNIQGAGAYKIGGTTVCSGTTCTPAPGSGNYIQNGTSVQMANFAIQNNGSTTADTAVIKQSTSQTGYLLRVQNSGATVDYLTVSGATGTVGITGAAGGGSTALNVAAGQASNKGVVVQGAASQTGDLVELQDSTGANLRRVDGSGNEETIGYFNNGIGGIGQFGNLLTFSEQFDNAAWTKTSVTAPTANTVTAPDGQTTAESLADSSSGGSVSQTSGTAPTNANYSFSVWLKTSSGTQAVDLRLDGATTGTGTKVTVTATTTWQRFSVTQNPNGFTGNLKPLIFPGGTGGSGTVAAWGAQLVLASNPQVYARTTSSTIAANQGVVSNGGAFISSLNASDVPLVVQSAVSQSSDLVQIQNVAGVSLAKISSSGALTSVGVNSGTGQIQGTGGLTVSGGGVSLNNNSNSNVDIATGTSTGTITLGGGSSTLVADTTNFDLSSLGNLTLSTSLGSGVSAGSGNSITNNFTPNGPSLMNGNLLRTIITPGGTTSGLIVGTSNALESAGAQNLTATMVASLGQINWGGAGTSSIGRVTGVMGKVASTASTGSIQNAVGVQAEAQLAGGAVTNYYGLLSTMNSSNSVAVQNAYGLKIDNFADTSVSGVAPTNFYAIAADGGQTRLRGGSTTEFQIQGASTSAALNVDTVTANLISNPSFETDTTGWAAIGSANAPATTTSQTYDNSSSMAVTTTGSNGGVKFSYPLTTSQYTFSVFVKAASGAGFSTLQLGYSADTSTNTSCLTAQTVVDTGWTRYTCTFTPASVSGTAANRYVYVRQTDATGRTFYLDAAQLELAAAATPYVNGRAAVSGMLMVNGGQAAAAANATYAAQINALYGGSGLLVKGAGDANLFSSLFNVQTAGGVNLINTNESLSSTSIKGGNNFFNVAGLVAEAGAANVRALDVKGASGQTSDLLNVEDSTSTTLMKIDAAGNEEHSTGYISSSFGGWGQYGNLLQYSEQLDQSSTWTNSGLVMTGNSSVTSPEGLQTSEGLTAFAGGGTLSQQITTSTNGTYTFSVWLQSLSGTVPVGLRIDSTGATPTTGTANVVNATTTWQRYSVTQTFTGTPSAITVKILVGNGAAGSISAWGAQLVRSSVPQVYARTETATVAATRGLVSNGDTLLQDTVDSTTAFQVQNASGVALFTADSTNERLYVGPTAGDTTGALLVLGVKTNSGDPSGVNGAMYYNSSLHQYRCYRGVNGTAGDGLWEPCGMNPIDRGYSFDEDFMGGSTSSGDIGEIGWALAGNGTNTVAFNTTVTGDADHPGIFKVATGTSSGNGDVVFMAGGGAGNTAMKINGTQVIRAGVRTGSTVTNEVMRVGMTTSSTASTQPVSGVWWEADASTNANWRYCYGNGTTATCTATASPAVSVATSTWYSLEIRVTAVGTNSSSVDFFINNGATMTKYSVSGVTVDTTNGLSPTMACWTSTTASRECYFDYYHMHGATSARH